MVIQRVLAAIAIRITQFLCGLKGHLIMLHFEPHKLSLHCGLCGYASEGWEVGRPRTPRPVNVPKAIPERRHALRPLSSSARLAS